MKKTLLSVIFIGIFNFSKSQTASYNPITTAIPVLNITPDARSGSMGEAGAAISADANALFWNPSKIAFIESGTKLSASYSPYLQKLDKEMNIAYASFAHKINSRTAFGGSMRYFNMGNVNLYDENATFTNVYNPNEFSIDASLARAYGSNLAFGLSIRYIHSNLGFGIQEEGNSNTRSVNAAAADVSMSYKKNVQHFGQDALFAIGANISNIGAKVDYTATSSQYFLPTNLKVGAAETFNMDGKSELTFTLDLNKLMVPTPPKRDANGKVIDGKEDDRSVVSGMFGSFTDAPGGFKEEFKEISYSAGAEYFYNNQFALRAGYFYENPIKGNRRYATVGAGLRFEMFNLDFSYLAGDASKTPLANSVRFTLMFNFDSK